MPTEVDWLAADINERARLVANNRALFAVLGDISDPNRHNVHEVAATSTAESSSAHKGCIRCLP